MFEEIMKKMFIERRTMQETAKQLGMGNQLLEARLHTMMELGYIEKAEEVTVCKGCALSSTCKDRGQGIHQYRLTEKGKRVMERED